MEYRKFSATFLLISRKLHTGSWKNSYQTSISSNLTFDANILKLHLILYLRTLVDEENVCQTRIKFWVNFQQKKKFKNQVPEHMQNFKYLFRIFLDLKIFET